MNKWYTNFISKKVSYFPCLVKHGNVSDVIYLLRLKNSQKFIKKLLVITSQLQNRWLYNFKKYGGGGIRTHELLRERISYTVILSPSRLTRLRYPSNKREYWFLHITSSIDISSNYYWKNNLKTKFIIILTNFNSWQQSMKPRIWDQE